LVALEEHKEGVVVVAVVEAVEKWSLDATTKRNKRLVVAAVLETVVAVTEDERRRDDLKGE